MQTETFKDQWKTVKKATAFSFLASVLIAAAVMPIIGCNTTATTAAYKAEAATITTVDTAMKAWADYVSQNHPPQAKINQVKAAYNDYYNAQTASKFAIEAFIASQTPASSNNLAQVTASASQSAAALVQLIESLTKGK